MRFSTIVGSLMAFLALPSLLLGDVAEIVERHERAKVAELEAYLKSSPAPADATVARDRILESYAALGDTGKMIPLLESKYASMPKGAEAPLDEMFQSVLQPLISLYIDQGATDTAKGFVAQAKADLAAHPMKEQIHAAIDQLASSLNQPAVGSVMEVSFTGIDGKEVDLAALKGKVVLVDFWATWCGPCVREMPNVVSAYEAYHHKGFEVIGISLDESREDLDAFLKENQIPWPQAFDGKGWGAALAQKFGITGIPATFLIGKDGKVVARDLRGAALNAQLATLLAP